MPPRLLLAAALSVLVPAPAFAQDPIYRNWTEVTAQDVSFDSGGARIAGSLYSPLEAPRAGLVIVHGPDNPLRYADLARLFATVGIAVLTYDQRGWGDSGGELPGPYSVSPDNIDLLAADAAAAMRFLAARPELAAAPEGFYGLEEAGWIVPAAAVAARETDFIVMWSAPATSVAVTLRDRMDRADAPPSREDPALVFESLRQGGVDPDPAPALAAFGKPSLWVYGTEDRDIAVDLSVNVLSDLIDQGHPEIAVYTNQEGRHDLDLVEDRAVFEGMVDWMLAQQDAPARR